MNLIKKINSKIFCYILVFIFHTVSNVHVGLFGHILASFIDVAPDLGEKDSILGLYSQRKVACLNIIPFIYKLYPTYIRNRIFKKILHLFKKINNKKKFNSIMLCLKITSN